MIFLDVVPPLIIFFDALALPEGGDAFIMFRRGPIPFDIILDTIA